MQGELADKERELASYQTLARTGGSELADLENRLSDLKARATAANAGAIADRLKAVDQAWYTARRQVLQARIAWTQLQQNNLALLTELAQLERDVAATQVEALGEHLAQLRQYMREAILAANAYANGAARDEIHIAIPGDGIPEDWAPVINTLTGRDQLKYVTTWCVMFPAR